MKNNLLVWLSSFTVLLATCDSKQKPMENSSDKYHSDGFTDKRHVEQMAKAFESAERDSMQKPKELLEYVGDVKGKTLMDIGAGTGYFSVKFAEKGAHVIAADMSFEFQNYLRKRIEKSKITNIELRKTPYDRPLLKENEADIVFIANTYHHIENRADYFSKVKAGLKENGELIVVDYFKAELPESIVAPPMEMRVSVDQVIAELKKAGFGSYDVEVNMLPYQYVIRAKSDSENK